MTEPSAMEPRKVRRRHLNPSIKLFIESMGVGFALYALLWLLAAI